jgi:DNA repair exonuclease SbcCD ATPase subunit
MKIKLLRNIIVVLVIIAGKTAGAQTAGAGIVTTIEAKAASIKTNEDEITKLQKKRFDSYAEENAKLTKLNSERADLDKAREVALDELKNGYFCSDCKRNKTRILLETGENFDDHIRAGASSGRKRVPASPEMIKEQMDAYDAKISAKDEQIKKFRTEENEFTRARADWDKQITNLTNNNDKLKEEIIALSKQYKSTIERESKELQAGWADQLMYIVAGKNYIEDRLDILNVKINDLGQEETRAIATLKDKIAKKVEEDKKQINNNITASKAHLIELEQQHTDKAKTFADEDATLKSRLQEVDRLLLRSSGMAQAEADKLKSEKENLESKIVSLEKNFKSYDEGFKQEQTKIEEKNRQDADKIWQLTINLSKIQDEALVALKDAFEAKRKILQDAKTSRVANLEEKGQQLAQRKDELKKKNDAYADVVDAERIRMMRACTKAGCSCYGNDARFDVVLTWNNASGCVAEMDQKHLSNDVVYGCQREGEVYKGYYLSFKAGMSDSDLEALQRKTSKAHYDSIFKKVLNK